STISAEQPNILFIFADDHSYEAVGKLGMLDIETPNIDRLMQLGTSFKYAYNMGSWTGAVCIASRTMLNTGTTIWRAPRNRRALNEQIQAGKTWSQLLKKAGYRTYMTGKWHLPTNVSDIFDVVADVRPGMPEDFPEGYKRPRDEADYASGWNPWDRKWGGFWEGGTHWSEILANNAEDFLEEASKSSSPFFMYLAFNAPHDPRQSPKDYVDRYPLNRVKVPTNFIKEYPYKDDIGCGQDVRDEDLAPFPRSEYSVKVNRQEYYAIITHMDYQIGRILDALDESGKADNTYIFFTADHGLAVGHHGLLGKQNMYEHSLRVPFIIVGPGVDKNTTIKEPIYLQDIMPTTLELAGTEVPKSVEFKSLLPILHDDDAKH
ncbi:MAG: sulfatase-like hydrolase/transferase, partial [Verrucomicrobiota bacterium]|nr:sulfatase-like hydrolase/transferase [Verrucomicrobiota bacterium]